MTKLAEWVTVSAMLLSPWVAVMTGQVSTPWVDSHFYHIMLLPVVFLGLFGVISIGIIAYRVAMFNECTAAHKELLGQIEDAKKDLKAKGFKFESNSSS